MVVAATDLPGGTRIDQSMIRMASIATASLPPGYFTDDSLLIGKVVMRPVQANAPLLKSGLAQLPVAPDRTAVEVKIDKVLPIDSGFVYPGQRVDVLVASSSQGQSSHQLTKTVLQDVLVVDGTNHIRYNEHNTEFYLFTLEVTPQQAENLAAAEKEGKLQIMSK